MNKDVYRHWLRTYGRVPAVWIGIFTEALSTFMLRILTSIILAQVAAHIASNEGARARGYVIYFLVLNIAGPVVRLAGDLFAIHQENKKYQKMAVTFHHKLVNKDMAFYRDHQTGYLATVFRQYLDGMLLFERLVRVGLVRNTVALVFPVIVLSIVDIYVGMIALLVVLVQLIYISWASRKGNQYRRRAHEIYRKMTGEVADEMTNILAFKSGGIEKRSESKLSRLATQETHTFWLRQRAIGLLDLPRSIITAIGVTAAFLTVVNTSSDSAFSVGLVVLTITYMFQIIRIVGELPELIKEHDELVTKIEPTLGYLKSDYEKIKDLARPKKLVVKKGAIDINNVSFSYQSYSRNKKDVKVFDNLNIRVKGGEQVGIVGLSGAGKSTLASLLMRFDDVGSGSIAIDGTDIRKVRQSDLRQNIAYVPQEPLLFHRTVKENIAYFNDDATEAAIEQAARAAHAHEFIKELPDGYDTLVGERGIKLSGGQKQRVAIARVILKDAPIMLFDEATSALDSESEEIIQRALPQIMGKRTAMVIAHRLSTVAGLDRIIVMHGGRVIEEGTHNQLIRLKGRYYSLWRRQTNEY